MDDDILGNFDHGSFSFFSSTQEKGPTNEVFACFPPLTGSSPVIPATLVEVSAPFLGRAWRESFD